MLYDFYDPVRYPPTRSGLVKLIVDHAVGLREIHIGDPGFFLNDGIPESFNVRIVLSCWMWWLTLGIYPIVLWVGIKKLASLHLPSTNLELTIC